MQKKTQIKQAHKHKQTSGSLPERHHHPTMGRVPTLSYLYIRKKFKNITTATGIPNKAECGSIVAGQFDTLTHCLLGVSF